VIFIALAVLIEWQQRYLLKSSCRQTDIGCQQYSNYSSGGGSNGDGSTLQYTSQLLN